MSARTQTIWTFVITSVALTAPWLLWGVFWVVMISGISRRRWNYRR